VNCRKKERGRRKKGEPKEERISREKENRREIFAPQ
jgi:hypothetical protein